MTNKRSIFIGGDGIDDVGFNLPEDSRVGEIYAAAGRHRDEGVVIDKDQARKIAKLLLDWAGEEGVDDST